MARQLSIAQGLREVKKLKGELGKQKGRVQNALVYVKGEEPPFAFTEAMEKLNAARRSLIKISTEIAVSNAVTAIAVGSDQTNKITIAQALREMAEIKDEISWHKGFFNLQKEKETKTEREVATGEVELISQGPNRQIQRPIKKIVEITTISNITIAESAARIEELQERFEKINIAVEQANHSTQIEA